MRLRGCFTLAFCSFLVPYWTLALVCSTRAHWGSIERNCRRISCQHSTPTKRSESRTFRYTERLFWPFRVLLPLAVRGAARSAQNVNYRSRRARARALLRLRATLLGRRQPHRHACEDRRDLQWDVRLSRPPVSRKAEPEGDVLHLEQDSGQKSGDLLDKQVCMMEVLQQW